jgi:hypothetical protein
VTVSGMNQRFVVKSDFLIDVKEKMAIRFVGEGITALIDRSIESICNGCFYECESLCEVSFESGCQLKEIGDWAFHRSGLKSILIPKTVEKICDECFYECKSLCEIVFESPSELKEIGNRAFHRSGLKSILIPKNVEKICDACFYDC